MPTLLKVSGEAAILIVLVLLAQWICGERLSARWRYALWLLVLLRLLLPSTISSSASLFNFIWPVSPSVPAPLRPEAAVPSLPETPSAPPAHSIAARLPYHWLTLVWLAGAAAMAVAAGLNHYRIYRRVAWRRPVVDASLLELLEDVKETMRLNAPVLLIETAAVQSPALFGFVRPRLLFPPGMLRQFSREELRHVFLHELAHVKRNDVLAGWIVLTLQIVHWFNPLVWLAFYRLRIDRELACDALALSYARAGENEFYGLTIVKLLESFGRPSWAPALAGILENKQRMKERINMIAHYHQPNRGAVLCGCLAALFALATLTDAQSDSPSPAPAESTLQNQLGRIPQVIATSPAVGASDVDPATSEITVTFDSDMGRGMSWTGGGPDFPPVVKGAKPHWLADKRTCVLPVKLEAGHYYRVGINSTSFHNFRSAKGGAARTSVIFFATQGASDEVKQKLHAPFIVSLSPPNGASGVSPDTKELRVTFNLPMDAGFSWCGGGPQFPTVPDGKKPFWSSDHKTCTLPVTLEPAKEYLLGINSESFHNFSSTAGVPVEPVEYKFSTAGQ